LKKKKYRYKKEVKWRKGEVSIPFRSIDYMALIYGCTLELPSILLKRPIPWSPSRPFK